MYVDVEGGEGGIKKDKKEEMEDQSHGKGVSIGNSKLVPGCSLCGWQPVG